jgi:hypothetical protein
MKTLTALFFLLLCLSTGSGATETRTSSSVSIEYVPPDNPALLALFEDLKREQFLEAIAEHIQGRFNLPTRLQVVLGQCDEANAFYVPDEKKIIKCLELLPFLVENLLRDRRLRRDEATAELVLGGAITFVALHEVGHAVIDIFRLPVLGREEDAADQISLYLLLTDPDKETRQYGVAGGLWFFRATRSPFTLQHLAGEHGLAQQRQANIACWAYGSDPVAFAWTLEAGRLSQSRAERCAAEFGQLERAVRQLLGRALKSAPAARR